MSAFLDRIACSTLYSCNAYPSCCYYFYLPQSYPDNTQGKRYPLIVLLAGIDRPAEKFRDAFIDFAEAFQAAIIAPVFPAVHGKPLNNYDLVLPQEVPYDDVLLSMVNEICDRFPVDDERFLLYGFSCGGQFAHRFLYRYPERLRGVSVGASGTVTLLDKEADWPQGVGNYNQIFNQEINIASLRNVPIQIVIGQNDTKAFIKGEGRLALAEKLYNNYKGNGLLVRLDKVDAVGHDGLMLMGKVREFFSTLFPC